MRIRPLIIAGVSTLLAVACAATGWPIPAIVLAIIAFGLATAWVYESHACYTRAGKSPPAWLARLERLRTYLADE